VKDIDVMRHSDVLQWQNVRTMFRKKRSPGSKVEMGNICADTLVILDTCPSSSVVAQQQKHVPTSAEHKPVIYS
jgi:hypothetical protein